MIPFGIIGTGKITRTFLEAVQSVPELTLRAVYSRSLEKAQSCRRCTLPAPTAATVSRPSG